MRILLLTNFLVSTDEGNLDVIIQSIQDNQVELLAISDCIEHTNELKNTHFTQNPEATNTQTNSQRLFSNVIEQVGGFLAHIDVAENQLMTFDKKKTRPMPWNAIFTIGSHLKINCSAYVSVQEEKFLAPFKVESINPNTITRLVTEYAKNNQPVEKPDEEDVIKAYAYGSTLVPLEDDVLYERNEKCFACLAFTKRELVLNEYLVGRGCHVVLPQKGFSKSPRLFGGLVDALKKRDMVIIARKVYRGGLNPKIVALFPDFLDGVPYMTMIEMAFSNDIALLSFPKLKTKKTEPTPEQERAIEELVNSMDLMNATDETGIAEAFSLETSLNIVNQHLCRTVAFRALHPTDPLPTIDPELMAMIDVPPKLKEASEDIVKELEELFPLQMVERKLKKVFGKSSTDSMVLDDVADPDIQDLDDKKKSIVAIGTVTPADDFGYLLKKGERFGTLAEQIQTVIYDLIFRTASMQTEKILECIMMYREQSKIHAPFNYNNWIKEMKNVIIQKNRLDFWQESIVKEGFGLISVEEAPISNVRTKDQQEFYEVASKDTHHVSSMTVDDDDDLDALM